MAVSAGRRRTVTKRKFTKYLPVRGSYSVETKAGAGMALGVVVMEVGMKF